MGSLFSLKKWLVGLLLMMWLVLFCDLKLPNILGAFLGAVQMILYVIFKYYKAPVVDEAEKPKTVSDHSINMVKLSSTPASGDLTVQPQTNPVKTHGGDLEDQMDKKMSN